MKLTIKGGMKGGKNHMIVLRNGMHVPLKNWAIWRDQVVDQLKNVPKGTFPEGKIITAVLEYYPKDRIHRDVPGVVDAVWHCLERAEIVENDYYIKNVVFITKDIDKLNPRMEIQLI